MTAITPKQLSVKYIATDTTAYGLMRLAPLTASAANEIVLTAEYKKDVVACARFIWGPRWRRYFFVIKLAEVRKLWLKCRGCERKYPCDPIGLVAADRHDRVAGKSGEAADCVKYDDYECHGWDLE
jgi:hypothetical protein